jgi:tRNA(Ile)-lysidine synthase
MSRHPQPTHHQICEQPLSFEEIAALFQPLARYSGLALAVSGGADSMALMRLVRIWLECSPQWTEGGQARPRVLVLTVNHGLRAEAAGEVGFVVRAAAALGFAHEALAWTGEKPKSGVQAAARKARYNLMASSVRAHFAGSRSVLGDGDGAIVTAHHLDDQAETLLMRLARGSGLDGLSAMAPRSSWDGVPVLRPFLGTPKSRLIASLRAQGNASERYERTAVRRLLAELPNPESASPRSATAGPAPAALALSARRLGRARVALELFAEQFALGNLVVHPSGFGEIPIAALLEAPEEIGVRTLARMAATFGGGGPPRLARIEAALERLADEKTAGFTLGGCVFRISGQPPLARSRIRAFREAGRMGDPRLVLAPGQRGVWDGRFFVRAPEMAPGPLSVRPLGADGARKAARMSPARMSPPGTVVPRLAAVTSPGFWLGDVLTAAPCLGAFHSPDWGSWPSLCEARFMKWPELQAHYAQEWGGEAR